MEHSSTPPEQLRSSCCSFPIEREKDASNMLYSALHFIDPFFHLVDLFILTQTCRRINDRITIMSSDRYRRLEVHGLESTSSELDLKFSDFLVCSPRRDWVENILFNNGKRFSRADEVILYNFDESADVFLASFVPHLMSIKKLGLYNCTSFHFPLSGCSSSLTSLSIGFNDPILHHDEDLRLPHLENLEIVGFPINNSSVLWLMKLVSFVNGLKRLRLNCLQGEGSVSPECHRQWNTNSLLSVEIANDSSLTNSLVALTDILFQSVESFPKLHTVSLTCGIPDSLLSKLSESTNLVHLVFLNCQPSLNLKLFSNLLKANCMNLQTLVVKFAGKCNEHLDSIVQIILNSGSGCKTKSTTPLPPLERLEIEVQVDPSTGLMETPYHSVRGLTTLRCRYRDNMYFNRSRHGFSMACQRFQCTETDPPNPASPMELFGEEMIKGLSDNIEGDTIHEWNAMGKIQRGIYVEIYDDFVDRELGYCEEFSDNRKVDVAATIANLRE